MTTLELLVEGERLTKPVRDAFTARVLKEAIEKLDHEIMRSPWEKE